MESNWDPFRLWVRICVGLISLWGIQQCWSLNDEGDFHGLPPFSFPFVESHGMHVLMYDFCCIWNGNAGLALLEFRIGITSDPYGALANWNPNDCDPCKWWGVHCADGKVQML